MTDTMATTTTVGLAPQEVARAYLQAWNDHDGAAVRALFAADGTYVDPTLPAPIGGEGVGMYVQGLAASFPDLAFVVEDITADGGTVYARWRMQGTNTGPLPGSPEPTGGRCDLPGLDVITVGSSGITSVVGYFDQKTFIEQLGLQAIVVPADAEPMHFGMSVRTDLGKTGVPGALTMTWIDVHDEGQQGEVQLRSAKVVEALAAEPGFLGVVGSFSGLRGHTMTAWTSPEAAESAIARAAPHRAGMDRVRSGGLGLRTFTSFWVARRLNPQFANCPGCGARVEIPTGAEAADCRCGTPVAVSSYI